MAIAPNAAAVNMAAALSCRALVASQRQVRQRMAGLRNNALVAFGAAGFMVLSQMVEHDASPSRVASKVVSGIGFLGAAIIYRDGLNVQGLNTAATFWCSAGVGLLAGVGAWSFALLLTGMEAFVNLGLRPLANFLKRRIKAGIPLVRSYRVLLSCASDQKAAMWTLLLRRLSLGGFPVQEISVQTQGVALEISALVSGEDAPDQAVEQAVHRIAAEIGVTSVRWMVADEV